MAYNAKPRTLSGLSAELQMDRRTLARKIDAAGLEPCKIKGRARYYWLADVVRAISERDDLDLTQERARKEKALADKYELDVRRLRAELIPAGEVIQEWANLVAAARARLLAIPKAFAGQLARKMRAAEAETILAGAIHEALDELAGDGKPRGDRSGPRDSRERLETAAPAHGQRVGGSIPSSEQRGKRGRRPVADQ